jgi:exosortase A-associated hydrolase 1
MSYEERPVVFECGGDELVGIVAAPRSAASQLGVLVVVGGPQYRVGSHRQFVLLARALAKRGIPCMRFDYRGMGDTPGNARPFSSVDDDIRAAADTFEREVPSLRGIVLWGLCDGASAACFYAPRDPRVTAVVLLNPWVRTDATAAKVYLEKYYVQRLLQPAFWKKLLGGGVGVGKALRELFGALRRAQAGSGTGTDARRALPERMAAGLSEAGRPLLVILSGKDFVANEFEQVASADAAWSTLLAKATVERLEAADHTFASVEWRDKVAVTTGDWVASLKIEDQISLHKRS